MKGKKSSPQNYDHSFHNKQIRCALGQSHLASVNLGSKKDEGHNKSFRIGREQKFHRKNGSNHKGRVLSPINQSLS